MPFVSKAQARWGNSEAGKKALGGAGAVKHWNDATNFSALPAKKHEADKIGHKTHTGEHLRSQPR